MKYFHISGSLLESLVLAGQLTACNNGQAITPTQNTDLVVSDQNVKLSAALRLVKDDQTVLQYIKNGNFQAKYQKYLLAVITSNTLTTTTILPEIYGLPANIM